MIATVECMDIASLVPGASATASAVLGGLGGLFERGGPSYAATLTFGADAKLPRGAQLFTPGQSLDAVVRFSRPASRTDFRTICLRVPDAYGTNRHQDFLLASSADGVPFHHAVLSAEKVDSRLYSTLWLYLAGWEPVVFGLRAEEVLHDDAPSPGDRFEFLVSGAVGRFHPIGSLTVADQLPDDTPAFAARNTGGGLRALPPALLYRG